VEHDAIKALEFQPDDYKALYRRAVARRELGNYEGAREDIKMFLQVGGEVAVAEKELAKIPGYKVENAGDKGLGVFALQVFRRGDLIVAEAPLFEIREQDDTQSLAAAVGKLSSEEVQKFVSLKNSYPDEGLYDNLNAYLGIFSTNAYQMDSDRSGIYLKISRFNHSCSPNARYSWNPDIKCLRVYALRDIAYGDEIFVSYLASRSVYGSSRAERQNKLNKRYMFTCNCTACGLQGPAAVASDERRLRINALWGSVPHFPPQRTRDRLLAIVQAVHLLEEEGYAADYDDFTNDAAAICAFHSDWASAKYWATKTYETRVAEFGEDSYRAEEVKAMMLDPKTGPMAGMGSRQTFTAVRL